jgi:hypothetical protein
MSAKDVFGNPVAPRRGKGKEVHVLGDPVSARWEECKGVKAQKRAGRRGWERQRAQKNWRGGTLILFLFLSSYLVTYLVYCFVYRYPLTLLLVCLSYFWFNSCVFFVFYFFTQGDTRNGCKGCVW